MNPSPPPDSSNPVPAPVLPAVRPAPLPFVATQPVLPPVFPGFDAHGNLPPRLTPDQPGHGPSALVGSLLEVRRRFVTEVQGSTRRAMIWDGWMRHRREVEACGVTYASIVGGSFLTSRFEPGDIDVCYLVEGGQVDQLTGPSRADLLRLFDGSTAHGTHHCHAFMVPIYGLGHLRFFTMVERLNYWYNVMGVDRGGHAKAYIVITERGTV